jgi:hypothetical protein
MPPAGPAGPDAGTLAVMSREYEPPRPATRPPGRPTLRPTRPATLAVAALVAAALAWRGISRYYGDVPDLSVVSGLTLAGLAFVEVGAAVSTWSRIRRVPRSLPLNPLLVARFAVLAKASSLGGSLFAGAYAGVVVWAAAERDHLRVAEANLGPAVVGLVGALMLVAAALVLEYACRVPRRPPEEEDEEAGEIPGDEAR